MGVATPLWGASLSPQPPAGVDSDLWTQPPLICGLTRRPRWSSEPAFSEPDLSHTTQPNTTQHNTTQHNTAQHSTTPHTQAFRTPPIRVRVPENRDSGILDFGRSLHFWPSDALTLTVFQAQRVDKLTGHTRRPDLAHGSIFRLPNRRFFFSRFSTESATTRLQRLRCSSRWVCRY